MLMLVPRSEKRTRARIRHKSIELRDHATEAVEGAMAQARAKAHQVKFGVHKDANDLQHRGQEVFDEQSERLSTA